MWQHGVYGGRSVGVGMGDKTWPLEIIPREASTFTFRQGLLLAWNSPGRLDGPRAPGTSGCLYLLLDYMYASPCLAFKRIFKDWTQVIVLAYEAACKLRCLPSSSIHILYIISVWLWTYMCVRLWKGWTIVCAGICGGQGSMPVVTINSCHLTFWARLSELNWT